MAYQYSLEKERMSSDEHDNDANASSVSQHASNNISIITTTITTTEADNPSTISTWISSVERDDIMSKELLQLSLKDRNDIQEEIHGVLCLAPVESPEMLQEALRKFSVELEENIPANQKRAYLQSQHLLLALQQKHESQSCCSSLPLSSPSPSPSSPSSPSSSSSPPSCCYINDDEFRLRFLRYELFDIPKAARRLCRFLDCILEYFGEDALRNPVGLLTDFSEDELQIVRKGNVQFLPYRDRAGRRILILVLGKGLSGATERTRVSY